MFDISQPITVDGERNEERYQALLDAVLSSFAQSPEGKACATAGCRSGDWASMFLHYLFDYISESLNEVTVRDVREVIFDLFPRKVSAEPDSAQEIVLELRAFWEFLGREHRLPHATAIVAFFSDETIVRLKGLLADPRNFDMAKSFVMQGRAAGFDMTTQEGCTQFMAHYNGSILGRQSRGSADNTGDRAPPHDIGSRPLTDPSSLVHPLSHDDRNAKRRKRKAERQARKRNRR